VTGKRYHAVDIARTAALAGMVVFHFVYDLDLFGWVPRGTATQGWFWYHARLVAGSFIFLAGLSLWLAHGRGIRWSAFARRAAILALAAAAVTVATHFALPGLTIFYGILHSILVSSVVGLLFLRLPAAVILAAAAAVFALPWQFTHPTFGGWLIWTGLAPERPLTADFEPFFPWFAPFLAGLASGRLLSWANLWPRLALRDTALVRRLAWPGRHSLAIYLIHQPVLIGLVAGATWAATHLR
jgi:uncharacterized membrane protein